MTTEMVTTKKVINMKVVGTGTTEKEEETKKKAWKRDFLKRRIAFMKKKIWIIRTSQVSMEPRITRIIKIHLLL